MSIQPGERIPDVRLIAVTGGPTRSLSTDEVFAGKSVVLFGVPGAFSPTCSDSHLPGFEVRAYQILGQGIDTIACVAGSDAFVMRAWARAREIDDEILMLADGLGDLARVLGLEFDPVADSAQVATLAQYGMRDRSKRFAAIVEDGVVRSIHVEPDVTKVTVSSAEAVVAELEAMAAESAAEAEV